MRGCMNKYEGIMKKIYALNFLLLITVHALHTEQPQTFFQTLRIDMRAWMKGEASDEQKERLTQQAGAVILAFSITIFCVAAIGDISNGQRPPQLRVWSLPKPSGGGAYHKTRTLSGKDLSQMDCEVPEELSGAFSQPTPPAYSAVRQSPPEHAQSGDAIGLGRRDVRSMQLPTEGPGSPFS